MKKKLILWILILSGIWSNGFGQTCLPDGITFTSQEQIDDFAINYPGCTEVLGDVEILGSNSEDINSLAGLSSITKIHGDLYIRGIWGLFNLSSLSGLENLTHVSNLTLLSTSISDINALNGLTSIGDVSLRGNENLQSLSGLENLEKIGVLDLLASSIMPLYDLSILEALDSIDGIQLFNFTGPINLSTFPGLSNMNKLEVVLISSCVGFESFSGLENIDTIKRLTIGNNNNIQDFSSISNIKHIDRLKLNNCDSLMNFVGLENIETLTELYLFDNDALQSFEGLNSLVEVSEDFYLYSNDALSNFNNLTNLISIGRDLTISVNNLLVNLIGFETLDSIGGNFNIFGNQSLENLEGIDSLLFIGGDFHIDNNDNLTTLSSTSGGLYLQDSLFVNNNNQLSFCSSPFVCDFISTSDNYIFSNNAEGCNQINEVLLNCFDSLGYTLLIGNVVLDHDNNCEESIADQYLENWIVSASMDSISYAVSTDSMGYYWLPVPTGEWQLQVNAPSGYFESCFGDTIVSTVAMGDSITTDFFIQTQGDCPYVDLQVSLSTLRPCELAVIYIDYCNYGGLPAEDIVFEVTLDSLLEFSTASTNYTIDSSGNWIFEIDSLGVAECGQIRISSYVDCDSAEIGDIQCVEVNVLAEELCDPDSLWDGSIITATGFCENDSIYFDLKNIGNGNMSQEAQFRIEIIIDDIVLLLDVDDYQLDVDEMLSLAYELTGDGLRIEADQTEGHPIYEEASAVVPSCDDAANNIILTFVPTNDGNPYYEETCGPIVSSFDPNIKSVLPIGLGDEHEIDTDWQLDYKVQFQNTGNDTAFLVVIRDTLSENLDLTTLNVTGASHPFDWSLNPGRELVFTFENILLPDSTTNEEASHGQVNFSITPRADLLPGERIENSVEIYFDFNDPVLTNTVFHTIRKPVIAFSEHQDWCEGGVYAGIAIWQDTSIQFWTEFLEYDSVRFVHFNVLPNVVTEDTLMIGVEVGTYFENILILGDTTFTQSYENQMGCDSLVTYFVNGLTDINEKLFTQVKVYPNPVNNFLLVLDHQNNENQAWELVNNLGIVIWRKQLDANEILDQISMASFPAGVYWLHVRTNTATSVWKVVKR